MPLIIIYPYMKRFTYWPQLILGIVFNWGVLIVSMQFNNYLSIIIYIIIFWLYLLDFRDMIQYMLIKTVRMILK